MALIVLDASVVIAQFDARDARHESASTALAAHESDDLKLPATAYAESLVDLARAGLLAEGRAAVAALGAEIVYIDEPIAERAAELRARDPLLRLPDAIVLACGEVLAADAVLTGDRRMSRHPRARLIA